MEAFSVGRVNGIIWRHMYHFGRSLDRLSDSIYWPVLDLILWGLTTKWISEAGGQIPNVLLIMLTAIVFWQIVWRANYEVSVNLLEEYWNHNLVNLFGSPLRVSEWVAGVMVVGVLKVVLTVIVGLITSWALYSMNIFDVGYLFIPFMFSLVISGWWMGFFASALIIYWGPRVQTFAWAMGFIFAPFCAVYYPLEVLPGWAQNIGMWLPMTYVFQGMRVVLSGQAFPIEMLWKTFALNFVYLSLSLWFFTKMFDKKRVKGLASMD